MGELEAKIRVDQILLLIRQVVEAAGKAKQSQESCTNLADKAQLLSYVLPLYKPARDEATRKLLRKLKEEALDKALDIVVSCKTPAASRRAADDTTAGIQRILTYIADWEKALVLVNQAKLMLKLAA